ncbi:MAG: cytidine/deoxycytidylate deaminase family protein [bacterium]
MTENTQAQQTRPSWDEYFLQMADLVGSRGTCDRGHVGCVITKDKRILATGYAGSPRGLAHCDEVGHEMHTVTNEDGSTSRHCIRTTHSETNAIANAARFGVAIDGSTIYVKMVPCYNCAKVIINAGITRAVCAKDYHAGERTKEIFKEAGVELIILNNEFENYKDQ